MHRLPTRPWDVAARVLIVLLIAALMPIRAMATGETAKLGEGDSPGDLEDRGLVDEGMYVSPQFGFTVEFSGDWDPDTFDYPISDEAAGRDELLLYNWNVYGEVRVIARTDGKGSPAADLAWWSTDEFLDGYFSSDGTEYEILATSRDDDPAGLLVAEVRSGEPETLIHAFQSLPFGDTNTIALIVVAYAGSFEEVLADARDGITIDGEATFDAFGTRDVAEALEDVPETVQTDEDAGLVEPGVYEGPAHGHEVVWDAPWELDPSAERPIRSSLFLAYDELYLAQLDEDGEPVAVLAVVGDWYVQRDASDYLDLWTDDEVLTEYWGDEYRFEVLLTEESDNQFGALVAVIDADGEVAYYDYTSALILREDSIITLTFASYPDVFEETFDALAGAITVEGEPVFPFADWEEIEDLLPE